MGEKERENQTVKEYLGNDYIKLIDRASQETKGSFFRNSLSFVKEHLDDEWLSMSHAQIGWLDKIKRSLDHV